MTLVTEPDVLRYTPLYRTHVAADANMAPYAGWEMPIAYGRTGQEVEAVRRRAGLFDVSHMGEFRVTGPGAADFLQHVTSNDVTRLKPFTAHYSLLLNEAGGVIDDIIVYRLGPTDFMIAVNAACRVKDWDWIASWVRSSADVNLRDISDDTALLAVQGPEAVDVVNWLSDARPVSDLARFEFREERVAGIPCTVSRTGYTGEDGFELFCAWDDAMSLWCALAEAGAEPAGLAARDVLRIEAAYPLYGHELQENVNALECGVGWAIKTQKPDFVGREAIVSAKTAGLRRQLVGLRMTERAIPREGMIVRTPDGSALLGHVTSGAFSPTVDAGIALARIKPTFAEPGTSVGVDVRGRHALAEVVALPFYRNGV